MEGVSRRLVAVASEAPGDGRRPQPRGARGSARVSRRKASWKTRRGYTRQRWIKETFENACEKQTRQPSGRPEAFRSEQPRAPERFPRAREAGERVGRRGEERAGREEGDGEVGGDRERGGGRPGASVAAVAQRPGRTEKAAFPVLSHAIPDKKKDTTEKQSSVPLSIRRSFPLPPWGYSK